MTIQDVVGAIIIRDNKVFSAKRGESKYAYVAHKYEFVGGKRENGETCENALVRECREEMDAKIEILYPYMTFKYDYPDFSMYLHTYVCTLCEEPKMLEHENFTWIDIADLKEEEWAPADATVISRLKLAYGDLTERPIHEESVFSGRILNVHRDTVLLPNGKQATREKILHIGASAVLVVGERDITYLCKQFRYSVGKTMLEIPAGKRDSFDEDYEDTARRELSEELGVVDADLTFLGFMYPALGYSDEKIALYLAEHPIWGEQHLDEDEFLNVQAMPLQEAVKMAESGEIEDSKTVVALLRYQARRK